MKTPVVIEGVRYHRFRVRFRDAKGRDRRWVRLAPASYFMGEQLAREFDDRDIEPRGNVRIREAS